MESHPDKVLSLPARWTELRCSTADLSCQRMDTDEHDVRTPRTDCDGSRLYSRSRQRQLCELCARPGRLHPPARVLATATGLKGLPAAVLGKTANRRSTRPRAARHLNQSTQRRKDATSWAALNRHSCPTSSRSSSETTVRRTPFHLPTSRQKLFRKPAGGCVIWTEGVLPKYGTGTGGLNSNDSGSGACPLTARSLCQHPCRDAREDT